jgi:hypothetical protein
MLLVTARSARLVALALRAAAHAARQPHLASIAFV